MRRRAFLVGGAAVVAAGAVGVEAYGPDKALHRLGLRSSPDHRVPPSGWAVEEGLLADGTRWALSRPEGRIRGAIVCLHGRGGDRRFAFDDVHLHDVVAHEGLALAVAAVDGGESSYWHGRADGSDAGALVVDELVPLVVEQCRTDRLAVLGWSMGGYGALLQAERNPGTFGAVVASSPALYKGFDDAAAGAFDSEADYERNDVFAGMDHLRPARVRVDCGSSDPFLGRARRFAEQLGARYSFTRGYHDPAYWRSQAPAQARFIAAALT